VLAVPEAEQDAYVGKWVHPDTDAPLEMVGRKGTHDMDWIAVFIGDLLDISGDEDVLDLCCGNGLVTVRIAERARRVIGVDFSKALLRQARDTFSRDNIVYIEGDARNLEAVIGDLVFHKAYLSAAFQYFDREMGAEVLRGLHAAVAPRGQVAILDIPDKDRKLAHKARAAARLLGPTKVAARENEESNTRFHTLGSRVGYLARNVGAALGLRKHDDLGWWWSRSEFLEVALQCGFSGVTLDQPHKNPHHTYRFDSLLTRST
jgi:SAM-dependent methyltransferase